MSLLGKVEALHNPVPASRPRVTRYQVYYPPTYSKWKKWMLLNLPRGDIYAEEGNLFVVVTHIVKKAKTSKLITPNGDVDNFDKAAFDALTVAGGYWNDDKQIEISFSHKRFAEPGEEPRTIVEIYKRN